MKRRDSNVGSMGALATLTLTLTLLGGGVATALEVEERELPPGSAAGFNVLLVTLDTVRADRLGPYGYAPAATPTLDRLADEGVVWTDAVAPTPLTLPSHASLMTGQDPRRHGVRDNGIFKLPGESETLAERLQAGGYDTAAVIGAFVLDRRFGIDQGFDFYDDDLSGGEVVGGAYVERGATAVSDRALDWLDRRSETARPFLLWLHYFDAHLPYRAPESAGFEDPYDAEIAYVDRQLGRVIGRLDESGVLDRTVVIVTADHGESLGEHGEPTHSIFIYESTVHVPLILRAPPLLAHPRRVADRVVGLVDVAPTLLGLLDVGELASTDGVDLLRPISDADRALYLESWAGYFGHGWAPLAGLRRHRDKYIAAPEPEYYELSDRPLEQRNRVAEGGAADELAARLRELSTDTAAAARTASPDEIHKLEALGYLTGGHVPGDSGGGVSGGGGSGADPKERMPLYQNFQRAFGLTEEGRLQEALELIESGLRRERGSAKAWELASLIYARLQRWSEAEASIRRAIEIAPRADRLAKLAQLEAAKGRLAVAEELLEEATSLDSGEGLVWMTRGSLAMAAGDVEGAIALFETAAEVDPYRVGALAAERIRQARSLLRR